MRFLLVLVLSFVTLHANNINLNSGFISLMFRQFREILPHFQLIHGAFAMGFVKIGTISYLNSFNPKQSKPRVQVIIKPATPPKTQIIFLHGLIEGDVEKIMEQEAKAWQPLVDKYNFVLVMPVGSKGAFPEQPKAYGWDASDIPRVLALAKNSDYDHSILFGYSNGAFLAGHILQQVCDTSL